MADLKERILDIIGQFQLSSLATITTDGKPWTRYVMVRADDTMTVRCATFVDARKVEHITANPEVHITCGCTNPAEQKPYLQIAGRARLTTDEKERHAFWTDMFSHVFEGPDDPKYGLLIIEPYRIEYCTPGSHEPEVWSAETE